MRASLQRGQKTPNGSTKNVGHLLLLLHPPTQSFQQEAKASLPVSLQSSRLRLQNVADTVMICRRCIHCAAWKHQLEGLNVPQAAAEHCADCEHHFRATQQQLGTKKEEKISTACFWSFLKQLHHRSTNKEADVRFFSDLSLRQLFINLLDSLCAKPKLISWLTIEIYL